MTPFLLSLFSTLTVCDIHFLFENYQNYHSVLQNTSILEVQALRSELCLARFRKHTHSGKLKKNRCYFFFRVEDQICLISWSTFSCSTMLFCIRLKLRFWNFRLIFLKMQFPLVATCFHYFWLSVWVEIYILNILMSF